MSGPILEVVGVEQRFGPFRALGPVDLVLHRGERLGIIGPNGSGKTTLINCISGTLRPQQGRVVFDGIDVTAAPPHRRARMGISRSFQIPKPFTGMTVLENLLVPIDQICPSADSCDRAVVVLEQVGLRRRADHEAGGLSQLELRKLELARALVVQPKVLVADEAMAGLSEGEIDDVLAILTHLSSTGIAIIMIEHIMHAVMRFSSRIVCFETGRKIADAAPDVIASDPVVQKVYFGEQTRH